MARTVRDAKLGSRAARTTLKVSGKPYFRAIEEGLHVGYRKGKTSGKWVMRTYHDGSYVVDTIGTADDTIDADGTAILTFDQAQALARKRFVEGKRVRAGMPAVAGPYRVKDAMAEYLTWMEENRKSAKDSRWRSDALILPKLGEIEVNKLTAPQLRGWRDALAKTPSRLRSRKGRPQAYRQADDDEDPEETRRKRRASTNRVITILKAALNHAKAEGKAACPTDAWDDLKPFRETNVAKVRYLLDDEAARFVNACGPDFRELVTAALLTGARYGEIARFRVSDLDLTAGTITVTRAKGSIPRHIVLTDEGLKFFRQQAAGRPRQAYLFERDAQTKPATRDEPAVLERRPWGKSHQSRPMEEACQAARIEPLATFHHLRHTHASRLARAGVPMGVIAAQLGHKDTRITERHYAHLAPSYVSETVRAAFGPLGILRDNNVRVIGGAA